MIGLRAAFRTEAHPDPPPEAGPVAGTYLSMLALTLSNPPTILAFTAIFAGFGLRVGSGRQSAIGLVLGVMIGSALWWVLLVVVGSLVRERLTPTVTRGVGVISGLVLVVFGGFAAASALKP